MSRTTPATGACRETAKSSTHAGQKVLVSLRNPPTMASLISAGVVRRAGAVALILGSVLTLAGQSSAIFGEDSLQILPLLLVYLTPFVVATLSQILGIRKALLDSCQSQPPELSQGAFFTTVFSHGIPFQSFLLGLVMGTVNTTIVVFAAILDSGDIAAIPTGLIGQAFVLPMLFGLVSQAIAYRRAASVVGQHVQPGVYPASA